MLRGMRLELTRAGDYAVRAMLALADAEAGAWLSARRISESMAIPAAACSEGSRAGRMADAPSTTPSPRRACR